jgi:hypothetical protein
MTIANVLLRPGEVGIVTDTAAFRDGRPWTFMSKPMLWPHISAAGIVRGPVVVANAMARRVGNGFCPRGILDAVGLAAGAARVAALDLRDSGDWAEPCYEAILVGWAPAAARFVGFAFGERTGGEVVPLPEGVHALPGPDQDDASYAPVAPPETSIQKLIKLAEAQHALLAGAGDHSTGGDLLLIHISPEGMSARKVARLAGYDDLLAAMKVADRA